MFNQRVEALATQDFTFHVNVGPTTEPTLTGQRSTAVRAQQFLKMVTPLGPILPRDIPIHVSDHDLGSWILGQDQRDIAIGRVKTMLEADGTGLNKVKHLGGAELKRLENKNRNDHRGWFVSVARLYLVALY